MFERSWRLFKTTWSILRSDKDLTTFPAIAGVVVLAISLLYFGALFVIAMANPTLGRQIQTGDQGVWSIGGIAVMFIYYLITSMVTNYLTGALTGAVLIRLRGGDPTLQDGFKAANARLGKLFQWSIITATVGMVINMIRNSARNNRGGNIVGSILASILAGMAEFAWNVASFLVVPIIIDEGEAPIPALKKSVASLKRTFGEQLIGGAGMSLITFLMGVGITILFGALAALFGGIGFAFGAIASIILWVIALSILVVIASALGGIFRTAVYEYAKTGQVPQSMTPASEMIVGAFKVKNG